MVLIDNEAPGSNALPPLATENFGYKQELKRALGFWDLVIFGMVYMLPIAPFAIFGIVDHASHGQAPLAYLIGAVVMGFTARSYALLSLEFPIAGSVYSYTSQGINPTFGFLSGWLIFLDYILAPGLLYVVSAAALHGLFPPIARWEWIVVFVLLGTSANLIGIKFAAGVNKAMLLAMLIVLAVFIVAAVWALHQGKGHGGLTWPSFYDPRRFSAPAIATGVLICSTGFLGFDAITTLAEEIVPAKRKALGSAGLVTLAIIATLFLLQTWLAADLAPGAKVLSNDTAFYDICRYIGGPWLYTLTNVTTALAFGIACAIVCQSAIARIIFAMARDRTLPVVFARVHKRTQQPYVANIFVGAVSLVVALCFQDHIDDLLLFQNFGALSAFSLVNISVIGVFWVKRKSRDVISHMILPAIGLLFTLVLLVAMRLLTLQMGGLWLLMGIIYYVVLRAIRGREIVIQA